MPARPSAPSAEDIERDLAERDPELVEAAREVDLSLLRWSLGLTPLERLRARTTTTGILARLRHGPTDRCSRGSPAGPVRSPPSASTSPAG